MANDRLVGRCWSAPLCASQPDIGVGGSMVLSTLARGLPVTLRGSPSSASGPPKATYSTSCWGWGPARGHRSLPGSRSIRPATNRQPDPTQHRERFIHPQGCYERLLFRKSRGYGTSVRRDNPVGSPPHRIYPSSSSIQDQTDLRHHGPGTPPAGLWSRRVTDVRRRGRGGLTGDDASRRGGGDVMVRFDLWGQSGEGTG
jgi:hypothetical protein